MLVLKFTLFILFCCLPKSSYSKSNEIDVCSIWSKNWRHSPDLVNLVYSNVRPAGGSNAGKYSKVNVDTWSECVEQCCKFPRCNVAYWMSSMCLHVECISDDSCRPVEEAKSEEIFYLKIRSVRSTAAAIDYDDPGHDECNETMPCLAHEQCEQVAINAQIKRNVCLCDRDNNFRRINGVCRQFLPRTRPCALYVTDQEDDDNDANSNSGVCKRDEECLPPSDRAKHGYCQCKLGFTRKDSNKKCVPGPEENLSTVPSVTTEVTSMSSSFDFEVQAGDDQIVTLPKNDIDLYGHILHKSNKSEVSISVLDGLDLKPVWSLKSSTNGANGDIITSQPDSALHIVIKHLQQGSYEFELKLIRSSQTTIVSDTVKIDVVSEQTTKAPLTVQVPSSKIINLPKQVTKIESHVEPSNQEVIYQWTYLNDGPVTPTLENTNSADLLISDLRPGNYTIQLDVTSKDGKRETRIVHLVATGKPIEARLAQHREIVFWPSNDVILDGTQSVVEKQTRIFWKLLSTDNGQEENNVDIVSAHALKTRIGNLRIGQYKFELTLITSDKQYVSKDEVVIVVYAQNGQVPHILMRLETTHVNILNNLVILNASATTADYGIAKWLWTKSPSSPAIGHFIDNSEFSPIAYVADLIEGEYVFILQVYDDRQQMSEANITVRVESAPDRESLVEIKFASKQYLYQQSLDNLLAQIRVFLLDMLPSIEINMAGILRGNTLLIKGIDSKTNLIVSPKLIADRLRSKIKSLRSASNMGISSIDTFLCLSNCSDHGKCDHETKRCVCDKYYMENWYKSFIRREPNCDFKLHYFIPIAIASSICALIFACLCCCCCIRWKRRYFLLERRKRIRYRLLHDDDNENDDTYGTDDGTIKIRTPNKNQGKATRKVISESDDLSDENGEQTLYDKPLLTSKLPMKSSRTRSRGIKVSVQDSNVSPVSRDDGQSSVTNDHSVA